MKACALDMCLAALMLAAALMLSVFVVTAPRMLQSKASYDVYDAVQWSPARVFMPAKHYSKVAVDAAFQSGNWNAGGLTNSTGSASGSALKEDQLPMQPGAAGRWLLPDADDDFDELAWMLHQVHRITRLWSVYTLVQGVILLLLILR